MALVIIFIPDPSQEVSEMKKVIYPDGVVAGYAWDFSDAILSYVPIQAEMRSMGINYLLPSSVDVAHMEFLQ